MRLSFLCLLILSCLFGCREAASPGGQIIFAVSADSHVEARLLRLEARLYAEDAPSNAPPSRVHGFALQDGGPSELTRANLPFSFGTSEGSALRFRLTLLGFDAWDSNAQPVIERSLLAQFTPGRTTTVQVALASPCLDRAQSCGAQTCTHVATDTLQAGACAPVTDAATEPVLPGHEGFVTVALPAPLGTGADPLDGGRQDLDAARGDADSSLPASDGGAVELDGALNAEPLPPEQLPACPFSGVCRSPDYPCVPSDDGLGYQCRGQLASWPMPDVQPGAQTPPRYTVRAEQNVVLDEVTGLLWQRDRPASYAGCSGNSQGTVGDTCTWDEAVSYCSQLRHAGVRWRLPSKIELESLLDMTTVPRGPYIDPVAFPDTMPLWYWSVSPVLVPACPNCRFAPNFNTGMPAEFDQRAASAVRCVHNERTPSAPPTGHYRLNTAGDLVRDLFTNLEWQRGLSEAAVTMDEAKAYCSQLGTGFRVPTMKELLTLMDLTATDETLDAVFRPALVSQVLRSITPFGLGGFFVYQPVLGVLVSDVSVENGQVPNCTLHVRCVR
ncbi:MAG: putative secreted protein [Myxococcaceae bacterium]|nr:putative secreted protein [Myxococcaceae bacterium]